MAELTQASEVYSPRFLVVWRTLLNWLGFLLEIFFQFLRARPSAEQVLCCIRLCNVPQLSTSPYFNPLSVVELPAEEERLAPPLYVCAHPGILVGDHPTLPKLTVVLDLDETLICAYETFSLPTVLRTQAIEAGLKWFELKCVTSDKAYEGNAKINYVTVFERPGLQEFLLQTSEFADLVLFTAGLEDYARPLVDKIDVDSLFSFRLYRPSTVSMGQREHVKDLACVKRDLCRTVIIDNNPFSFLLQPLNGIPCVPFSAAQPHDEQLLEVLLPLLRHLSTQLDVRPILHDRFHMPEWFQKHGVPASDCM